MLELMILGFLAEGPLHGYQLRRKMNELYGFAKEISDGSLYPAIQRLIKAGAIVQRIENGRAAQRHTLELTPKGREDLEQRLRSASGGDVSDLGRFMVILAFLSRLPDVEDQHEVLERRLKFLEAPASFFYENGRPLRSADIQDIYRQGMLTIGKAASRAEIAWLRHTLGASAK
ncbi:PadR family transcriptional regulator [Arthrobacter sp. DNA4]|uniref:PadR family transcriptional regulator n=1 Tax=Micrococcaceae TaxID=1268 RepID=UPI0020CC17C0|nr:MULTISPECIES: PadR family transcriptional regulator [Micrococcaceae]UTT71241.1 PadR family transcriptional regulator [Arthrobacter sp. DNA4]WRT15708.1 PadR family transcriptional regulator [Pseudarthrobacter sp. LT1]